MNPEQALVFLSKMANDYSKTLDRSAEEAVQQMAHHCLGVLAQKIKEQPEQAKQCHSPQQ